jgi:hypothetical protein
MKYTFTLREQGTREKIILESRGDQPWHVLLKLLAYICFRTDFPHIQIEQFVGQRHKPDLVALAPITEQVELWIDCGQIETDRLGRICRKNRDASVYVFKSTAREASMYFEAMQKDIPPLGVSGNAKEVCTIGFDNEFLAHLQDALCGNNRIEILERRDDFLSLQWDKTEAATILETTITRLILQAD